MKLVLAGLALFALGGAVRAEEFSREFFAIEFGTILAAEKLCGFSYDAEGIKQYLDKEVPADDIAFPVTLRTQIESRKEGMDNLVGSEKVAFCLSTERTAKEIGIFK